MGMWDWTKRQPKRATDYVKTVTATEQVKGGFNYFTGLYQDLKTGSARHETFENASSRLKVKEQDLPHAYNFYTFRFNLFLFFTVVAIIFLLYFAFTLSLIAFGMLGFLAIAVSQLFDASFRMMQIRHRELLPVSFWLNNPSEWWIRPLPPAPKSFSKKITAKSVHKIKK